MSNSPDATPTLAQYRDYIMQEGTTEGERLSLQHTIFKPNFLNIIDQVLDDYGLAERLKTQSGEPVRILDLGCGEGLYLHDVAEVLESRHLLDLKHVQLIGLDISTTAIGIAYDFAKASQPPRPYLHFYTQDLTAPFNTNPALSTLVKTVEYAPSFDFIYAMMVMEHIHDVEKQLGHIYSLLKPGGVLYLRDLDNTPPDEGAGSNPVLTHFSKVLYGLLASNNNGQIVAYKNSDWLKALGAEKVMVHVHAMQTGGTSREGMLLLRDFVYLARTAAPVLVRLGLLTKEQHEEVLQALFTDLSPDSIGIVNFIDTVARKPL